MPKKKKKNKEAQTTYAALLVKEKKLGRGLWSPLVQRAFLHQGEIRGKNIIILHVDSSGLFLLYIYIYMLEYKFHIN
jgi:hypothetical protein